MDPGRKYPDYPSVLSIWGRSRRDEAERFADLVSFLKENGVIADYNQVALLLHSVREDHSGPYLAALDAKGIPAFCPRSRAFFETTEIRYLVACYAILFGWYGSGRGQLGGAVAAPGGLRGRCPGPPRPELRLSTSSRPGTPAMDRRDRRTLREGDALDLRPADYFYRLLALEPFRSAIRNENTARNFAAFSHLLNVFQELLSLCGGHAREP